MADHQNYSKTIKGYLNLSDVTAEKVDNIIDKENSRVEDTYNSDTNFIVLLEFYPNIYKRKNRDNKKEEAVIEREWEEFANAMDSTGTFQSCLQ